MKKLIFILSLALLFSCSKPEDNQPVNSNVKLLKSVTEVGGTYSQFCSLYYENNSLIKYNFGEKDFYIEKRQLAYENNKIKKLASGFTQNQITNAEDFTYNYDFSKNLDLEIISYTTNTIFYQSINRDYTFNLNNQNQVISILENNSLAEEFIYSGNQIIKQKRFGSYQAEYTFTVDDKINPFNELYTKFGLVDAYMCPLIGHAQLYYLLFPNNVTKVFKDGTLLYSFSYQYNSENYPVSVVAYDYANSKTHQYTYVYTN
jgi:hypothetical protein